MFIDHVLSACIREGMLSILLLFSDKFFYVDLDLSHKNRNCNVKVSLGGNTLTRRVEQSISMIP